MTFNKCSTLVQNNQYQIEIQIITSNSDLKSFINKLDILNQFRENEVKILQILQDLGYKLEGIINGGGSSLLISASSNQNKNRVIKLFEIKENYNDVVNKEMEVYKLLNEGKKVKNFFEFIDHIKVLENWDQFIYKKYRCLQRVYTEYQKEQNHFPEKNLLTFVFDLLHGLIDLRRASIIHLDIKIPKILINEQGNLVFCDFGISEIKKQDQLIKCRGFKKACSPIEQIEDDLNDQIDYESDIYSLGKTIQLLVELFIKKNPQSLLITFAKGLLKIIHDQMILDYIKQRSNCYEVHSQVYQLFKEIPQEFSKNQIYFKELKTQIKSYLNLHLHVDNYFDNIQKNLAQIKYEIKKSEKFKAFKNSQNAQNNNLVIQEEKINQNTQAKKLPDKPEQEELDNFSERFLMLTLDNKKNFDFNLMKDCENFIQKINEKYFIKNELSKFQESSKQVLNDYSNSVFKLENNENKQKEDQIQIKFEGIANKIEKHLSSLQVDEIQQKLDDIKNRIEKRERIQNIITIFVIRPSKYKNFSLTEALDEYKQYVDYWNDAIEVEYKVNHIIKSYIGNCENITQLNLSLEMQLYFNQQDYYNQQIPPSITGSFGTNSQQFNSENDGKNFKYEVFEKTKEEDQIIKKLKSRGYKLEGIINGGGFGIIVQAKNSQNKEIAIKIFEKQEHQKKDIDKEKEIYDLLKKGRTKKYIIEYLEHIELLENWHAFIYKLYKLNLLELLNGFQEKNKKFTEKNMLTFLCNLIHGLIDLRRASILHLDIKASNILVTEQENLVYCDFGTSQIKNQYQLVKCCFFSKGSSPIEQMNINLNFEIDFESDIYTLGILLQKLVNFFINNNPQKINKRPTCYEVHQQFYQLFNEIPQSQISEYQVEELKEEIKQYLDLYIDDYFEEIYQSLDLIKDKIKKQQNYKGLETHQNYGNKQTIKMLIQKFQDLSSQNAQSNEFMDKKVLEELRYLQQTFLKLSQNVKENNKFNLLVFIENTLSTINKSFLDLKEYFIQNQLSMFKESQPQSQISEYQVEELKEDIKQYLDLYIDDYFEEIYQSLDLIKDKIKKQQNYKGLETHQNYGNKQTIKMLIQKFQDLSSQNAQSNEFMDKKVLEELRYLQQTFLKLSQNVKENNKFNLLVLIENTLSTINKSFLDLKEYFIQNQLSMFKESSNKALIEISDSVLKLKSKDNKIVKHLNYLQVDEIQINLDSIKKEFVQREELIQYLQYSLLENLLKDIEEYKNENTSKLTNQFKQTFNEHEDIEDIAKYLKELKKQQATDISHQLNDLSIKDIQYLQNYLMEQQSSKKISLTQKSALTFAQNSQNKIQQFQQEIKKVTIQSRDQNQDFNILSYCIGEQLKQISTKEREELIQIIKQSKSESESFPFESRQKILQICYILFIIEQNNDNKIKKLSENIAYGLLKNNNVLQFSSIEQNLSFQSASVKYQNIINKLHSLNTLHTNTTPSQNMEIKYYLTINQDLQIYNEQEFTQKQDQIQQNSILKQQYISELACQNTLDTSIPNLPNMFEKSNINAKYNEQDETLQIQLQVSKNLQEIAQKSTKLQDNNNYLQNQNNTFLQIQNDFESVSQIKIKWTYDYFEQINKDKEIFKNLKSNKQIKEKLSQFFLNKMGQNNQKNRIFYKNELAKEGDFLKSKSVINSKVLYLEFDDSDESLVKKAFIKLPKCQNLTDITIYQNYESNIVLSLVKSLEKLQKLINLKLQFLIGDSSNFRSLCQLNSVPISENLILVLTFKENFKTIEAKSLFSQLSNIRQLTELQIKQEYDQYFSGPSFVTDLAENLRKCQKLRKLLYLKDIREESDLNSLGLLRQIQNLQELHLNVSLNKNMNIQQSQQFANQFKQFPKSCSFHLRLSGCKLNLSGIIDGLQSCQSLTYLTLNRFEAIEMPKLGFYLGKIQNLQSLEIDNSYETITCTEGEVLSGIQFCKNLKNLKVSFLMDSSCFPRHLEEVILNVT
ncbi:hypothetical protein ABPG72_017747, partial [Tetrahymena utriculariae]